MHYDATVRDDTDGSIIQVHLSQHQTTSSHMSNPLSNPVSFKIHIMLFVHHVGSVLVHSRYLFSLRLQNSRPGFRCRSSTTGRTASTCCRRAS